MIDEPDVKAMVEDIGKDLIEQVYPTDHDEAIVEMESRVRAMMRLHGFSEEVTMQTKITLDIRNGLRLLIELGQFS